MIILRMPPKVKKYIFLLSPVFLVLSISIYFRSFPVYFPQLKNKAKEVVYQFVTQGITQDVYNRFRQFNPLAKDKLIRTRVAEYKKADTREIQAQIQEGYRQLKDRFQDDKGQTYLMELDCWHWARYVDNVLKLGHPGDKVENGKQIDSLMLAPLGSPMHWEHSLYYFSAFLYKAFSLFKKNVPLFTFLFYSPLFFVAVFIILLYMFMYRYGGHIAAVTSCMMMGLSPIFLQRSCAGWFDKDVLSLTFPLLVIWSYVNLSGAVNFKSKLFWICLSSFWVGLFCYTWTHWWLVFMVIIIYEVIFAVSLAFAHFYLKKPSLPALRGHLVSLGLFFVLSLLWVLIFSGPAPLKALYKALVFAVTLNKPLMTSIWPNVYSTVGELRSLGIAEIANSVGGMSLFVVSLLSLPALFIIAVMNKKYAGPRRNIIFILSVWSVVVLFASTRGIRFVMFLPFSLGISLGWVIADIYGYFRRRKKPWLVALVLAGFFIINGALLKRAYSAASNIYPLMNDTWYKVMSLIKEKTPEGAIVNSWWDFGDWFKAVARRPVIFDGQSQDSPQAYWVAKAMLASDEEQAIGILRMLNNGGNKAFEIINGYIKDQLEAVLLLESIIGLEPDKAGGILQKFLPGPLVQEVMQLLYSRPGKASFVVDNTMLPKMGAISYLGTWNFSKVYIAQNFNKLEKEQIMEHLKGLGRNLEEAQRLYQEVFLIKPKNLDDWLSNRVLFYGDVANGREKDGLVFFDNGFIYNPKDQTVRTNGGQIPRSLFLLLDGKSFVEITYPKVNMGLSVLVLKGEDGYKCILLDRELANSMFVRLYFFKGLGLKHFTPLIDAQEDNNYIRVFNIIW